MIPCITFTCCDLWVQLGWV